MKNTALNSIITNNDCLRTCDSEKQVAAKIFAEVLHFRRASEFIQSRCSTDCLKCCAVHLPKIIAAVTRNEPVVFVLPAFPGKSPNPEKVLGAMPDQAERLALDFLGTLCQRIKKYYAPGIKIILCSDGRVFSDVVGMHENNVTAYQCALNKLISDMSLFDLSILNLDDFYDHDNFKNMRDHLMNHYGNSLDYTRQKVRNGALASASADEQEANCMYRGITRFLFEDALYPGQIKSRSALQRESRVKAYEVIRRSNAWSALIAERFPEAIRLSIHPQTCGAQKVGIRLIGNERWMTPWHGVAVETNEGYVLLKRAKAEALGATLLYSADGRPSHYQLITQQNLSKDRLYEL